MQALSSSLGALLISLSLVLSVNAEARPQKVGQGVSEKTPEVKVSDLLEKPRDYLGKTVKVRGVVSGVCSHRGCWMKIAGDKPFQAIRIKVKDGAMVFPADAKGKQAVAQGVFQELKISREQALRWAEHQAKMHHTTFDPEKVTAKTLYQLAGTGAEIE